MVDLGQRTRGGLRGRRRPGCRSRPVPRALPRTRRRIVERTWHAGRARFNPKLAPATTIAATRIPATRGRRIDGRRRPGRRCGVGREAVVLVMACSVSWRVLRGRGSRRAAGGPPSGWLVRSVRERRGTGRPTGSRCGDRRRRRGRRRWRRDREQVERVAAGGHVELDVDDVVGEGSAVERRGQRATCGVGQDVGDQDAGERLGLGVGVRAFASRGSRRTSGVLTTFVEELAADAVACWRGRGLR